MNTRQLSFVTFIFGTLAILSLPALIGRPLISSDTKAYYVIGGHIAEFLRITTAGESGLELAEGINGASNERAQRGFTTGASRSPYYSFYFYMIERLGGLWSVVAVQAALSAWIIKVYIQAAIPSRNAILATYITALAVISFSSTLPIYVAFMMPDVFAGLALISAICLLFYYEKLSTFSRLLLVLVSVFSASVHQTNIALLLAAGISSWLFWPPKTPLITKLIRSGLVMAIALSGVAGTTFYSALVKRVYNTELKNVPFITARVLADGPGRRYLAKACSDNPDTYILCKFQDKDLSDAQVFLWNQNPEAGVWAPADTWTRIRLVDEQKRFVLGAILFEPLEQVNASLRNFGAQLMSLSIGDVLKNDIATLRDPQFAILVNLLDRSSRCKADILACAEVGVPNSVFGPVTVGCFLISCLSLVILMIVNLVVGDRRLQTYYAARSYAVSGVVVTVLVFNAAICGILSEPSPRYQTRLAWALPLVVLVAWKARK